MSAAVLITGASSGLGLEVARQLSRQNVEGLVVPVRNMDRGQVLQAELTAGGARRVYTPYLDLASQAGVNSFIERFEDEVGDVQLQALVLNAGVQSSGRLSRTEDGLERTFAVNHLAHYQLYKGLSARLTDKARIGWTASGTHDPNDRAARLTGFRGSFFETADKLAKGLYPNDWTEEEQCKAAYATSKLCNILTARFFARNETGNRTWFSFDPGLMPGTGLAREHPTLARFAWKQVMPRLGGLIPGASSAQKSGSVLADHVSGERSVSANGAYIDYKGITRQPYFPTDEAFMLEDLVATSEALLTNSEAKPKTRVVNG